MKLFHILFTVMFGVFAGAIVVYTKNIFGIIIIHALHNIISNIGYVLVKPWAANQLSLAKGIETLVGTNSFWSHKYIVGVYTCMFGLPVLCIGIILLKKYNGRFLNYKMKLLQNK